MSDYVVIRDIKNFGTMEELQGIEGDDLTLCGEHVVRGLNAAELEKHKAYLKENYGKDFENLS